MKTGAYYQKNGSCEFVVWAPFAETVSLKLFSPSEKLIAMKKDKRGYWKTVIDDISLGDLYVYQLEAGKERPDPASHYQPQGVHGPSQVVDHQIFNWTDSGWRGIPLPEMIMYELHTGTFTPEGTFEAIIPRLDELIELGVNAIEIMPVTQFPGERNWGYDGVYPFAVQNSYGGPDGLKRLVNACHQKGISVILDIVYNHMGPEGNYLRDFGPYFTDRYKTPWGEAMNFDGPYSNEVRKYFIKNALYWFENFHIDVLRIDAVHGIFDMSAKHFLKELAESVGNYSQKRERKYYLIAESDLNDTRVIQLREKGGYGLDGHWCDDFHHCLHTLLSGENDGYYADFGRTEHLVKSLKEGFVYSGQYSQFRRRNHGNSSKNIPPDRFVVFAQNHDQTGNRMNGERLSSLASFESQKLAAGLVLLSPYIPLLFMGEEYGETSPFLYFVSHSDEHVINAVKEGRKKEFASFNWDKESPNPQNPETFQRSRLNWEKRYTGDGKILLDFYRTLISMRKEVPALANFDRNSLEVEFDEEKKVVMMKRWKDYNGLLTIFNLGPHDIECKLNQSMSGWEKIFDSADEKWKGQGTLLPERISNCPKLVTRGESFALYEKEDWISK
jgi:maltooligosyltrehalose trehalohydrolase